MKVFNASKNLKIQGKDVIVIFATYKSGSVLENENEPATPFTKKQKVRNFDYTNFITLSVYKSNFLYDASAFLLT